MIHILISTCFYKRKHDLCVRSSTCWCVNEEKGDLCVKMLKIMCQYDNIITTFCFAFFFSPSLSMIKCNICILCLCDQMCIAILNASGTVSDALYQICQIKVRLPVEVHRRVAVLSQDVKVYDCRQQTSCCSPTSCLDSLIRTMCAVARGLCAKGQDWKDISQRNHHQKEVSVKFAQGAVSGITGQLTDNFFLRVWYMETE